MALVDNKITLAEYADKLISTLPVKPKITAAELQSFLTSPALRNYSGNKWTD